MELGEKEKRNYLKRLHVTAQTSSTPGLLNEAEEIGLRELFPEYYERFIAVKQMGFGAYKRTIQLRNPQTGQLVAFKIVSLDDLRERALQNLRNHGYENPIEAFEKESRRMDIVAKKGNNHVTVPIGHGLVGRYYFFLEEYSERTLLDYVKSNHKKHPLSEETVTYLALQLADGLATIHREGLYHGDLHPDNILFRNAELRITDFDLCSSMFGLDEHPKYLIPHAETRAPELYEGSDLDTRVDVWAWGADVFFMEHSKMPFPKNFKGTPEEYEKLSEEEKAQLRFEIYLMIRDEQTYSQVMHAIDQDFEPGMAGVLKRCLERDPAKRFPNAVELYETLKSIVQSN